MSTTEEKIKKKLEEYLITAEQEVKGYMKGLSIAVVDIQEIIDKQFDKEK